MKYDIVIVGAGIVGLATAWRLAEAHPEMRIGVLEKEAAPAMHQTGRNSGVLHAGIYYAPGSVKAETCRAGRAEMIRFCEAEGLPYERCGKVIVAAEEGERARLDALYERGRANGLACRLMGPEELRAHEPHAAGVAAVFVPETGIVDYGAVSRRLVEKLEAHGHAVVTGAEVTSIAAWPDGLTLMTTAGSVQTRFLVGAAGVYADRLARRAGLDPGVQIVPFRGEYYELAPASRRLCQSLIYPVPDPAFPFLGVHFTRHIDGRVSCGPNAVLAFAREGYRFGQVDAADLAETLGYPGFRRLAAKHWRHGLFEMARSVSMRAYVRSLRRLVPDITGADLLPAPSGIRAQALHADGTLADDFLFAETKRAVFVLNAPSPAATAALAIGTVVARRLAARLGVS